MSLSAYVILSFIMPFSRNMKWVENSTASYYYAYAWIEKALLAKKSDTWSSLWNEHSTTLPATAQGDGYTTFSSGQISPPSWEGNSEFDHDYNRLWLSDPIQMEVWYNKISNWTNVKAKYKIPQINGKTNLSINGAEPLVYWTLSRWDESTWGTLMATGNSIVNSDKIISAEYTYNFSWNNGLDLDGNTTQIQNYYTDHCTSQSCILKITVLRQIQINIDTSFANIPYLEYKIDFWAGQKLPLYYTVIEASGKSFWFEKDLKVRVPQQTVNQAFDFTVFQ